MAVIPKAGDLDQLVSLEAPGAPTTNALGGLVPTWVPLGSGPVWAKVEDLRGQELLAYGQQQTAVERRIKIRYRSDVTSQTRVVFNGRPHSIVGSPIVLGRRAFLELMCTSGPAEVGLGGA